MREKHGRGTQGKAKIPFATFVWALVLHALSSNGTIGAHQPLAVVRSRPVEQSGSRKAEGELTIARRLLPFLPKNEDVLVLMDRLYGNGDFVLSLRETAGGAARSGG